MLCCLVLSCVVLCCLVLCEVWGCVGGGVQDFRGCVQDLAGPPSAGTPPSAGPPKISLFFFNLTATIFLFLWSFRGILVVFEGLDPEMCTFGLSGCRVKPRRPRSHHWELCSVVSFWAPPFWPPPFAPPPSFLSAPASSSD